MLMKILTSYNEKPAHDYEDIDYITDLCDGGQYISINEIVQRTIRGESLDIHDYSKDNWIDACDNFDVMDMYMYHQNQEAVETPPQEALDTPPQEALDTPPQE